MVHANGFTMREMSMRSGVSEATLRMWENRHGFPAPERLPSGHRRYSEGDLERVLAVVRARERGLSLPVAIAQATRASETAPASVYASLVGRRPELRPHVFTRRALVTLSHAIEDECATRGERPLLIGAFQAERHYRAAESRWCELARTASRAVVLAEFSEPRNGAGRATEVPLPGNDPLMREWAVICVGSRFSACLIASELPRDPGSPRRFEAIWSVAPEIVADAARACCEVIAAREPELAGAIGAELEARPPLAGNDMVNLVALTGRMVSYAVG